MDLPNVSNTRQEHHQDPAIEMVGPSSGVLCLSDWLRREMVAHAFELASLLQVFGDVIAFAVYHRVDLCVTLPLCWSFSKPISCVPAPSHTVWPFQVKGAFHMRQ